MRWAATLTALALVASAPLMAGSEGLARAAETLRKMRELRAAKAERTVSPEVTGKFGHLAKPPPAPPQPTIVDPPELRYPDLKPTGTIRVGSELRVVLQSGTYAVGDEVEPGWRVTAITPKKLSIASARGTRDYKIP